jgi:fumarate reductase subunit C
LCVEFHASIGLYRLAIKWGAGASLSRRALRRIEGILLWFFLGLGVVILLVLAGVLPPPFEFLITGTRP